MTAFRTSNPANCHSRTYSSKIDIKSTEHLKKNPSNQVFSLISSTCWTKEILRQLDPLKTPFFTNAFFQQWNPVSQSDWNLYVYQQKFVFKEQIDLSPPSHWQMPLANQCLHTNTLPYTVNKTRGHVVFTNSRKVLLGCAERTMSTNSSGLVYFTCLAGRSYLSSGDRSVAVKHYSF